MSPNQFRGIASNTHRDLHGERVTKQALEQFARQSMEKGDAMWGYWSHQTTLPPIMLTSKEYVEPTGDGEHQLVVEGEVYGESDYQTIADSSLVVEEVATLDLTLDTVASSGRGQSEITIAFDPRNIEPRSAKSAFQDIAKALPTARETHVQKEILEDFVVFVSISFALGFIQRYGEVAADGVLRLTKKCDSYSGARGDETVGQRSGRRPQRCCPDFFS